MDAIHYILYDQNIHGHWGRSVKWQPSNTCDQEHCALLSTITPVSDIENCVLLNMFSLSSEYVWLSQDSALNVQYGIVTRKSVFDLYLQLNKANLRDLIAATGLAISNWIQIVNFSARVTVKFDGWPCKTIGQLFYATSSFVHHFVPIGEFKLKLQSGNTQSGSNWMIFRAVRPWNLTDDLAKQ